jgi:DNA-directed RNA polymerase beta' subunit
MPRAEQKGVPVKALRDRIRAKTGRVRYNLMGKRVDFSARSVITPDASISVREVVTPLRVAMRLTFKEIVNEYNIKAMRDLVKNRDDKWPGANFVVPYINGKRQKKKYLQGLRRDVQLNIGDEVHRHLQDGDVVLFNRQPTLHKQSMMAHIVRVMQMPDAPYHQYAWSTFRIHLSTCSPYNADFDGDEMNMHVPQSYQTQIELRYLASVGRQMVSSGISKPLIGSVQDNTLGGWLMSGDDVRIDSWIAMDMLAYCGLPNSVLHTMDRSKTYTGKELLSMILPPDLNMTLVKGNNVLNIDNGIIQPGGNMDKSAFGAVSNGILHWNWFERGHQGTSTLLDMFNKLTRIYLIPTSFTVGSGDIEVSKEIDDSVQKVIDTELLEIQHMITEAETSTVLHDVDILEPIFQGKLDGVRENVGKAVGKSLSKTNAFSVMEVSGAKGSVLNTAQMMACVGQQAIEAKRVVKRVNGRTLSHYHQDDDSGPARGFIRNNYYKGLTPQEFIFHMMSGREGMIDTAIKTAETGYIQRRLVKALEDLQVLYDATVRTAGGTLLQPLYGYNGIDPSMQARLLIGLISANNTDVRKRYCFENEAEAKKHGITMRENDDHYARLLSMRDQMRDIQRKMSWSAAVLSETITSPIKFDHLIRKWRGRAKDYKRESPLDARYVFASIEKMLSHEFTPMYRISQQDLKSEDCIKLRDEKLAKTFLRTILHEYLSPKRCIVEYGFGRERFDELCREAIKKFHMSRIQPGTMVGVICAQSVGQPATQLTLNSVDYREKIVVKDRTGARHTVMIGQWIDNLLKVERKTVQDVGNKQLYLDTNKRDWEIMSISETGETSWKRIEGITRHLPQNRDGSSTLLRVKTQMGREVTATKAKSFLVADAHGRITELEGDQLKTGMRVPLVHSAPIRPEEIQTHLSMECYFPKTEYIWGTEMERARKIRDEGFAKNPKYHWFNLHNGRDFTIPYARSDIAGVAIDGKPRVRNGVQLNEQDPIRSGCIYMKNSRHLGEFPESFPLDLEFGFLVGAYLAEGCVTDTYVAIANNDQTYRDRIRAFCDRLSIGTHDQIQHDKIQEGWTSSDIRIHSILFARLLKRACGKGSANKRVPDWALNAPDEFVKGLLDGYFSGDGSVLRDQCTINCSSVSLRLVHGIQQLLFRYGILGRISSIQAKKNNRGSKNILRTYMLTMNNVHARKFREHITLLNEGKQERLNRLSWNPTYRGTYHGHRNLVPYGGEWLKRDDYRRQMDSFTPTSAEFMRMIRRYEEPVYYDEVVSIEEVQPTTKYVYDLTVADTKNFVMHDGFSVRDTFHQAGIAGKSIGNLGVPRLRELMAYSKNPKTPRMTIPLKVEYENRLDIVQSIASELKYTVMNDITQSVQVIWDPDPSDPKSYMQIDQADNIYYGSKCQHDIAGLPWLMRIVLNPEGMLNSGIQLLDIKSRFCTFWGNRAKEIKKLKKKEEKHALDKVTRMAILSNYSTSKEIVIHIRYDTTGVSFNNHMALADLVMHRFKLKGIDGITAVDVDEEQYKAVDEHGGLVDKKRYVIHTEGVNLVNIRYLNFIDINRVVTNHVVDIYAVMGIEAARAATKLEYKKVIEGSGAEADYRHLALLSDFSTNTGNLVPVDRHGMTKSDAEFLAKATNEMTVEQLVDAAFYRQSANMQNVSSRIMTGMAFNGGSNAAKIFIDFDELEKCEYIPEESAKGKRFNALTANHMIDDIIRETERQEAGGSDSDVSND